MFSLLSRYVGFYYSFPVDRFRKVPSWRSRKVVDIGVTVWDQVFTQRRAIRHASIGGIFIIYIKSSPELIHGRDAGLSDSRTLHTNIDFGDRYRRKKGLFDRST